MLGSARSVLMKKSSSEGLPGSASALYSLNENTGTTAADTSGNNRTLTLNGASWDASGHTSSALTNTTTNQGARAGFPALTAATIMAWVKPLDLTSSTTHLALGFIDSGDNTSFAIFTQRGDGFGNPDVLQGDVRLNGSLNALHGPALTVGTWTHLALTYSGSSVILYKDGVSVANLTSSGTLGTTDFLCVAGGNSNGQYDSDVVVDDVRVYNSALTPGQIVTGMNTPVA